MNHENTTLNKGALVLIFNCMYLFFPLPQEAGLLLTLNRVRKAKAHIIISSASVANDVFTSVFFPTFPVTSTSGCFMKRVV